MAENLAANDKKADADQQQDQEGRQNLTGRAACQSSFPAIHHPALGCKVGDVVEEPGHIGYAGAEKTPQ